MFQVHCVKVSMKLCDWQMKKLDITSGLLQQKLQC